MRIDTGQTKNYAESDRDNELAIIDETDPKFDDVVAIPAQLLARPGSLDTEGRLPFRIVVKDYFPNSGLNMRDSASNTPAQATAGIGLSVVAVPAPITYKDN